MELSWGTLLSQTMKSAELGEATIVSCGDAPLPLPALVQQRLQDPHASSFYDSFAVQHESSASEATVNVWTLSADSLRHRVTPQTALRADQLASALFVVVVDLARPWRAVATLERWAGRLDALAAGLALELPPGEGEALREAQRSYVQRRYAGAGDEGGAVGGGGGAGGRRGRDWAPPRRCPTSPRASSRSTRACRL